MAFGKAEWRRSMQQQVQLPFSNAYLKPSFLLAWALTSPLWANSTGHISRKGAAGEREAVYKRDKELFFDLHTLVVEERPDDGVILRRVSRSEHVDKIRAATLELADDAQQASDIAAGNSVSSSAGGVWMSCSSYPSSCSPSHARSILSCVRGSTQSEGEYLSNLKGNIFRSTRGYLMKDALTSPHFASGAES